MTSPSRAQRLANFKLAEKRAPLTNPRDRCQNTATLQKACTQTALMHYLDTLLEHGERLTRESLEKNPAKFITLINACCNSSSATIAEERLRWHRQAIEQLLPRKPSPPDPASPQ